MKFNEDSRVKIPTILHLMQLGYKYLSLKDPAVTWDESTNTVSYTHLTLPTSDLV